MAALPRTLAVLGFAAILAGCDAGPPESAGAAVDAGTEASLRDRFRELFVYSARNPDLAAEYVEIHAANLERGGAYDEGLFSFVRRMGDERLIIVSNSSDSVRYELSLLLPPGIVERWHLGPGRYELQDRLAGGEPGEVVVDGGSGSLRVALEPLESVVYRVGEPLFKSILDTGIYVDDVANAGTLGTLLYRKNVASAYLDETRNVAIWLPPGYEDDQERRYPVIYMSDGENLFDPRIASWGIDWGVDEAIAAGAAAGRIPPAIVVGTWSTARRMQEYSPWHDAPSYARFLLDELMPRINREFRTLTGPGNTHAMGSSMGGLLAYYLVLTHPDVFGACGCVSTALPLSPKHMARAAGGDVEAADPTPYITGDIGGGRTLPPGVRLYFDHGIEVLDPDYQPLHLQLRAWLSAQGRVEGRDFLFREYEAAAHNEAAWRARLPDQLRWLLAGET
jgi:enterochelin esterase-like enzyme